MTGNVFYSTILVAAMLWVNGCSNKPLSVPPQKEERINPAHKVKYEELTMQEDRRLNTMRSEALAALECDFISMEQTKIVSRSKRITDNPRFTRVVGDYKAYK